MFLPRRLTVPLDFEIDAVAPEDQEAEDEECGLDDVADGVDVLDHVPPSG